jgi:hypothetical protein
MTVHFHLESRSRINGAIALLPNSLLRPSTIHRKNYTHFESMNNLYTFKPFSQISVSFRFFLYRNFSLSL